MQVLCGLQVVFFLFNCQTPDSPSIRSYFICMVHFSLSCLRKVTLILVFYMRLDYNLVFDTF